MAYEIIRAVSHSKILCLPVWCRSQETTCPGSCLLSVKTKLIECNTINWVKCKYILIEIYILTECLIELWHVSLADVCFLAICISPSRGKNVMIWYINSMYLNVHCWCSWSQNLFLLLHTFFGYHILHPRKLTYWFTWKHGWLTWTSQVCKGESSEPYCSLLCSIC